VSDQTHRRTIVEGVHLRMLKDATRTIDPSHVKRSRLRAVPGAWLGQPNGAAMSLRANRRSPIPPWLP
jgi:hypothetical protein